MRLLTVRLFAAAAAVALLAGSAWALSPTLANIEAAETAGIISHDEAALNTIQLMFDRSQVDARLLVDEPPLKCGTAAIHALRQDPSLSAAVRQTLETALAGDREGNDVYISPSGIFYISYSVGGTNGVSATDVNPANGVPDYIDHIAEYLDFVWDTEITSMGFTAPLLTGGYYTIIIQNLSGVYGYTTVVGASTRIYLDNDYVGFPANDDPDGDALGAAKVTCAHEFKHASQYTCSHWTEGGWVELDATWMEDQAYPLTNDYINYVNYSGSPLTSPQLSLDAGGSGSYEDCIWQTAMSEIWGIQFIVDMWGLRQLHTNWTMYATYDAILSAVGADLASYMAEWTRWNYLTGYKYSIHWNDDPDGEGGYPDSQRYYSAATVINVAGIGGQLNSNVQHMASRYVRHYNLSGLADFPKIVFNGDDATDFRPQVIVKRTDGTLLFDAVPVDDYADGELTLNLPFSEISEIGISFPNCGITGGTAYLPFSYQLLQEQVTAVGPLGAAAMRLHPAYPNPFNPKTTLRFELAAESSVTLKIVSPQGRVERTLLSGAMCPAGENLMSFDGRNDAGERLASGVYFAMLNVGGSESQLTKLTLLK